MNLLPLWVWMRATASRRGSALPEQDPGDMGTAFGLDAFSEATTERQQTSPAEVEARAPWTQRLARRPRR